MPGPLAHVGNTTLCTHGVPVQTIPSNMRVLVSGQPVTLVSDTNLVGGCPFTVPPVPGPMPCLQVQWLAPAVRVLVNGQPPLLQTSIGLCISAQGTPNGPAMVVVNQPRVIAT
jgi:hypothetical protein